MERDGPPAAPPDPGWRDIRPGGSPLRDSREDGVLVKSDPTSPGSCRLSQQSAELTPSGCMFSPAAQHE
eukprot:1171662-Rhodomonas_salina.1